ncbi:hypothetical protein FSP39_003930 [Pinctada imbricata]|uniref:unspecific monooxygenase n=1 Tax=Pinctada imbricata TaxID=66713 RepID=A0AA88XHQ0_PINIB|nr:hypothetical protein FSP39_003930 [Pinctada imbricata]
MMVADLIFISVVFIFGLVNIYSKLISAFHGKRNRVPRIKGRLPFIGHAHLLDMQKCHIKFEEWTKQYGPIFEVRLYDETIVVLNDYKSVHDALVKSDDAFAGRPKMYRTDVVDRSRNSIVWQTYTPKLVFLRKEVLKSLKAYGDGLDNLEQKCIPEMDRLVQRIRDKSVTAFDPAPIVHDAVSNVMMSFLLGCRFEHGSREFCELKKIGTLFNVAFGSGEGRSLDILPWLRFWGCHQRKRLEHALTSRDAFWEKITANYLRDESVIGNIMRHQNSKLGTTMNLNDGTIKEVFTNLVLAGTDTTTTAIVCLLSLVLHYPKVQRRIQGEIDKCTEGGNPVTLADRQNMPYTQAVILETLRYIAHVPLAVPHCTIRDVHIQDYFIPENTTVYINIWAAHHDPEVWPDPYSFKPERFLEEDGSLVHPQHHNRKRLLVFGAGRRVCLGEVLAKNRLFLFVTSLFKNFTFQPEDHSQLPEVDPRKYELGLVLHPQKFQIKAIPR